MMLLSWKPARAVLLAMTLFFAGIPLSSQSPRPAKELERFVPRMHDAKGQIDHARRLKRKVYSQPKESRDFWRKLAVEAYQAVRVFHAEDRKRSVEASFRAGELLRSGGLHESALQEFTWASRARLGAFSTRAMLEIGHIHRRERAHRRALDAYLDVAADARADAPHRDDAWLWAGHIWRRDGRTDDARGAWRRVAERGQDPLDRIRAFDLLGELWLVQEDIEAACGVLNECLQALAEAALEETRNGERVRNALLRMRLVEQLPRAIASRNISSREAGTSRNP